MSDFTYNRTRLRKCQQCEKQYTNADQLETYTNEEIHGLNAEGVCSFECLGAAEGIEFKAPSQTKEEIEESNLFNQFVREQKTNK